MSSLLRRFAVALVAIAVGGATILAVPAAAGPPEKTKGEFEFEFTSTDACGEGIDILLQFERVSEEITFTDENGETTREIRSFRSNNTWTRSDNGNTTVDRNRVTRIDTVVDGELVRSAFSGPQISITVPGEGRVILVAGRVIVEDGEVVFERGPDNLDSNFFPRVCAALA